MSRSRPSSVMSVNSEKNGRNDPPVAGQETSAETDRRGCLKLISTAGVNIGPSNPSTQTPFRIAEADRELRCLRSAASTPSHVRSRNRERWACSHRTRPRTFPGRRAPSDVCRQFVCLSARNRRLPRSTPWSADPPFFGPSSPWPWAWAWLPRWAPRLRTRRSSGFRSRRTSTWSPSRTRRSRPTAPRSCTPGAGSTS